MVSATLEGLWMRIVDFRFFVKLHRSGPVIIFSFWSLTEHVSYASKKLLIKQKTSSTWCVLLWKDYVWFLIEMSIFDFSSNFTGRDMQYFQFLISHWTCQLCIKKAPKQAKDFFNMVIVSLEELSMFSDRSVDFLIFRQISQVRPDLQ